MNKYIAVITNADSTIKKHNNLFGIDYIVNYYEEICSVIRYVEANGRVSLIVIDAVAKAGSEPDIIKVIRNNYLFVHIPVIIVGDDGDVEYEKRCFLEWGSADFIPCSSVAPLLGLHAAVHMRWFELAFKDQLTNLYNRHYYSSVIDQITRFCFDGKLPISICMIDIDYFKRFNDTYGHPAGDCAIEAIASTIQKNTPITGISARYGGEEFVVILPTINEENAKIIANGIIDNVRKLHIEHANREDGKRTVTISIGATTGYAKSDSKDFIKNLIEKADANLYKAKGQKSENNGVPDHSGGRDRFVHESL